MKKNILILFLIFFSAMISQAQEKELSKDEFLAMMDSGKIKFSVDPWLDFPTTERDALNKKLLQLNSNFDPNFMFVRSLKTNRFVYTVWYEWPTRKCIFRSEEYADGKTIRPDFSGKEVNIKYCEIAYKMKIK